MYYNKVLILLLLRQLVGNYVPYDGLSCAEDVDPSIENRCFRNFESSTDIRAACWTTCLEYGRVNSSRPVVAAYASSEFQTCCCATSCRCLLVDRPDVVLAVGTQSVQPTQCTSSLDPVVVEDSPIAPISIFTPRKPIGNLDVRGYDVFNRWTCGPSSERLLVTSTPFEPMFTDPEVRSHLCWRYCVENTNASSAAAAVNATSCECLAVCDCLEAQSQYLLDPWVSLALARARPIPVECYPSRIGIEEDVLLYTNLDCQAANVTYSYFIFFGTIQLGGLSLRSRCLSGCEEVVGKNEIHAAYIDEFDFECRCYASCDCLEVRIAPFASLALKPITASIPDSCDTNQGAHAAPSESSLIDNETYFDTYLSVSGYNCPEETSICYNDFLYDPDDDSIFFHTHQCFAFCQNWLAPIDGAYVDSSRGICCCAFECDCVHDVSSTSMLALSKDLKLNVSLQSETLLPPLCTSASSKKSKNAAISSSNLWWIILIGVVVLVMIGFIFRIEQIDRDNNRLHNGTESPGVQNTQFSAGARISEERPVERHSSESIELVINDDTRYG